MGKILVSGGAGFIGSHTMVELILSGHEVVCGDNYSNSSSDVVRRVGEITNADVRGVELDFCNEEEVGRLFRSEQFDVVIHFSGYKSVNESIAKPLLYYCNNIISTLSICLACRKYGVKRLIFSSSATVYGVPRYLPLDESHPVGMNSSPYGNTKYMIEQILHDLCVSDPEFSAVILRYFNPVGAHFSGKLGETPVGVPNNLMPYLCLVAAGVRDVLSVFGNDYGTPDGTCVRDFIHVVDLARGHVAAVEKAMNGNSVHIYNLGTGKGTSVLELIRTFERVNNIRVPFEFTSRREGDIEACWADARLAKKELGWEASLSVEDMVHDSWLWQTRLSSTQ